MKNRKINWRKIIGLILCVTLGASIVFSIYMIATAPAEFESAAENVRTKDDYVLMLLQCVLGLVVMFLPSFIEKEFNLEIPSGMTVLYFIFLYCAIYLGEVRDFYYLLPHWDTILHTFSGVMLGALGFALVGILNNSKKVPVHLSPAFVGLFAFCFAVAMGVLWEIYEFSMDGFFGLNMQKAYTQVGRALEGRAAVSDTMKDLIVDTVGALVVTLVGTVALRKKKKSDSTRDKKDQ